jgi:hypothetical protein
MSGGVLLFLFGYLAVSAVTACLLGRLTDFPGSFGLAWPIMLGAVPFVVVLNALDWLGRKAR